MSLSKRIYIAVAVALAVVVNNMAVSADQESPDKDYSIVTTNKDFVFVMLIPDEDIEARLFSGESILDYVQEEGTGISKALRSNYPCSGLYQNNDSNNPIWTVDWYARRVYVHSDGQHLVRVGGWPRKRADVNGKMLYDELAVAFYSNGNEVNRYTVEDLVLHPELLPHSVSHYRWESYISFDEASGILSLYTETGETYRFDVLKMSSADSHRITDCKPNDFYQHVHKADRIYILIPLLLGLVAFGGLCLLRASKAKRM